MIYPLYVTNIETYMPIAVCGKNLKEVCFVSKCIIIIKKICLCFKHLLSILTKKCKEIRLPIVFDLR